MSFLRLTSFLLALSIACDAVAADPADPPVNVSVYTESLCPDTRRLFTSQSFTSATRSLPERVMNVTVIPWGHASQRWSHRHRSWLFTCQHGPVECLGNALHACAVTLYPEQRVHLPYMVCMYESRQWHRVITTAHRCARARPHTVNFTALLSCATGQRGNRLLHRMGVTTGRKPFIPWISVDGDSSWEVQRAAWIDLTRLVCDRYTGEDRPGVCDQYEVE